MLIYPLGIKPVMRICHYCTVLPYLVIWKHISFPQLNLGCTIHLLCVLNQETPPFKQKIAVLLEMEKKCSYCDVLVLIITYFGS